MVAGYTIDNNQTARALIYATKRNCTVLVLADYQQMYHGKSTSQGMVVQTLLQEGVEVRTYRPPRGGMNAAFHTKMMVVRDWIAMIGSANWTYNSMELCVETSVLTRARDAVENAQRTFDRYWAMSVPVDAAKLKEGSEYSRNRTKVYGGVSAEGPFFFGESGSCG